MKERPILFSSPMVRAILEGRKTQTRRVVKPQPTLDHGLVFEGIALGKFGAVSDSVIACPYGTIGDRLWVRETWRVGAWLIEDGMVAVDYKADGLSRRSWLLVRDEDQFDRLVEQSCADAKAAGLKMGYDENYTWGPGNSPCRWRPSIHMPRWANRITLEITGIRVERVQEITEEDARAEGITDGGCLECGNHEPCGCSNPNPDARDAFIYLWDSINSKRHPWASNPWVWVIEFRRLK